MKAMCLPGPNQDLKMTDIPIPEISADEALIKMKAIGVGVHDRYFLPADITYPFPLGMEGAGIVQEVGDKVKDFQPGDRVMIVGLHPKGGTWAEYAAINEQMLMPMPEGLSFEKAAALPIAGDAALEGVKAVQLDKGDFLFIAGASGAIGTIAIQLATGRGYHVAASASPRNHDYLRSLGVELAVDYRDPEWPQQIRKWLPGGVDAALAIQPGTGQSCIGAVRDGGRVVTISGDADNVTAERGIRVEQMMHHPETRAEFLDLASDVAAGRTTVTIEQVFPFKEAAAALEKTETRHARGKIIITVGND